MTINRALLDDVEADDGRGKCQPKNQRASPLVEAWHEPWIATILVIGFFWDLPRASLVFLGPYYVNDQTHDPFLVGLVGAASWAFLILGPILGTISDRRDRRHLITGYTSSVAVAALAVGCLTLCGKGCWQTMFVLMLILSFCQVLQQTTLTPYIADTLSASGKPELLGSVIAVRTVGFMFARVAGIQLVGIVVQYFGVGAALLLISAFFTLGSVLSIWLPAVDKLQDIRESKEAGNHSTVCNRAFMSVFGVTVLANLCYWSYEPLVPVLGTHLQASPSEIGLLGSMAFIGGLIVSLFLVGWNPSQTGFLYCAGITMADVALIGAGAPSLLVAACSLFLSGCFASLFSTVQNAMVVSMVPAELRGRAMGLLTLAIGAGPVGMAAMGETASLLRPDLAIRYFGICGAACQIAWLCIMPDALYVRRLS